MNQRQCVILKGDSDWCWCSVQTLLADFDNDKVLCLSNNAADNLLTIPQQQAQSQLGKEFDVVIFDGQESLNPDSLGIVIGTIKAGGIFILLLPELLPPSLFLQRFNRIITHFQQQFDLFQPVHQGDDLPSLVPLEPTLNIESIYQTSDQQLAVSAILKVVHGHRRRPLVLSADRGRGKSAALGIAAAQLIEQGKRNILVTAPSLLIADTVFEHANRLLPHAKSTRGVISVQGAKIRFIAPDALIESEHKADLVLVDEAAAIPAAMLEKILKKFSRLVFATTLHGYEGTGRGFAVRFQQILDQQTPDWHSYRMNEPIRWRQDDQLEAFSFQALLLDAVPVEDELILDAEIDCCHFEQIDRQQLVDDEQSLRELFGLMVLAHYRTRPSDLQMMLDRDDISVYVMRYHQHIIASAWVVSEGELADDISTAIYNGQRRLKGHLLPQSLLAHTGVTTAGPLRYQRIIRIAVHPALQQRGIGKTLLNHIAKQSTHKACDLVGTSFGVSTGLLAFWTKSEFIPVRLGIHHDDVSGSHALIMLQALSPEGQQVLMAAQQRFQQQWFYLLHSQFKRLNTELVVELSQLLEPQEILLSAAVQQAVKAFAFAQRGYEFSQVALWHWLTAKICQENFLQLSQQQQQLCVESILQQRDWADISKRLQYTGKAQVITALRVAVSVLLDSTTHELSKSPV